MNSFDTAPSPSRRERPAKSALTRDRIVATALTILETEGLGKVTMRRIAAELDTGAASLYVYVRNTEDLHAQVLEALLAPIAVQPWGSWRERLTALLSSYTVVLFEHPEIARITMTTHPDGPHYLALFDTVIGLLGEGGVADSDAAWAVDLLLAFATATAVEHGGRADESDAEQLSGVAVNLATVDPATYPHLHRIGEELLSGTGTERFQWGLDVLINGILTTPRPSSRTE